MKKNKINKNLDLDLIELFQVAWNGKWIISAIMVVSLIISVGYYNKKNDAQLNYFTSEIEFLKINIQEAGRYSNYNSLIAYKATESEIRPSEFLEINPQVLFELYLEVIQDKQIFKDAIKNSEMINKKNYPSEKEFISAMNKKTASIMIYPPDIIKKKYFENDKINLNWRINFFHNDEAEWNKVFEEANKLANEKVKETLKIRFSNSINHERKVVSLKVKAIDLKIKDLKYGSRAESESKLRFLKQQAELARLLNFKDNNIIIEDEFQNYNTRVTSNFAAPLDMYYLKGYKVIEKEIEFISENLKINNYEYNETILLGLEIRKNNLLNDDTLGAIEKEFNSTPITSKNFTAATILYEPVEYVKYSLISTKLLAFVILMSIAVGLVFLLILRQIRRTSKDRY